MRRQLKSTCIALALVLLYGASLPAAPFSVRQYTRGLFTLTGHVGLRLDERRNISATGSETKTQILRKEFDINTKGFVWDPRFMQVNAGLGLQESVTKTNAGRSQNDLTRITLNGTLFPRWRYPYRPINLHVNKSISTAKPYATPSYELETTTMGARWGLTRKPFGFIRLLYDLRLSETAGSTSERDETTHNFDAEARKTIRKGQWGETKLTYGYELDSTEDAAVDSSYLQHYFYSEGDGEFGEKAKGNANVRYYIRTRELGGTETESDFFNASARLNVKASDRLRHNYSLGLSRNSQDGAVSTSYTGSANATYQHLFNDDWQGTLSSTLSARASRPDSGASTNSGDIGATGSVRYGHTYDNFLIRGNYALTMSQSMGDNSQQGTIAQSAYVSYQRLNKPLYSDQAEVRVRFRHGETETQSYNTRYRVTSLLSARDRLQANVEYSLNVGEDTRTSITTSRLEWKHRLSRVSSADLRSGYRLSTTDSRDSTNQYIDATYSTALFRRRNLRFFGRLRWQQTTADGSDDTDEIRREANVEYSLGKWRASLEYDYREVDSGSGPVEDNQIMFYIRRFYGFRY